jgi:hypothetical protein
MFRLMRNVHLGLGLVFVMMALVFALSSVVIIYRPATNTTPLDAETAVQLPAEALESPRAAAQWLMVNQGLKGDLRAIQQKNGRVSFRIVRPSTAVDVNYDAASGEAKVKTRRFSAVETLVQLHTNHGFHHEHLPTQIWSAISFLSSAGLILLGLTGIYLWFAHHKERVIGSVLLGFSLVFGIVALVLTRMEQ